MPVESVLSAQAEDVFQILLRVEDFEEEDK